MPQHDSEEFVRRHWFDNRELEHMCQPDELEFGLISQSGDREFKQMYQPNNKDPNQTSWHDRREYKETFWPHDKDLNRMPNSREREFKESSKLNAREFRRIHNLDEHEMERGMSDNFDREYRHDKNQTLTHDERRFNPMYYTAQDFNQISGRNEREFNAQFHCDEREKDQVLHSYDENYKQISDFNKERFGQNPYENKVDKLSDQSDIGFYHSSNYDKRFYKNFDFDKQVSDPNNRHHNQMLLQNKREYNLLSCDDNRPYAQLPKYDDRRLRFNNDQLACKDHQNQMNQDDLIDTNRMQNNVTWNKMQDLRSDGRIIAANSVMYCPSTQVPGEPPQGNMMMQSIMNINQAANKNQLCALRFLTKKIAHTALHANVKSILANARRLSNIAKARSRMENSASNRTLLNSKKHGKGIATNKFNKHTVPDNQLKPATNLKISQNSKVIKKASEKQSALNKSTNKRVSSQNKNAKKRFSRSNPKGGGNTTKKLN